MPRQMVEMAALGASTTSSAVVATSTSVIEQFNLYAPLIGTCISILSILVAVVFHIRVTRRYNKQDRILIEEQSKEELTGTARRIAPDALPVDTSNTD